MASKRVEISYPDGSRKKISAFRFEQMRSTGELRQIGAKTFQYVGQPRSFHTFVDFAQWQTLKTLNPEQVRRYLDALRVIFEQAGEREWQYEETPEAFKLRLTQMGCEEIAA